MENVKELQEGLTKENKSMTSWIGRGKSIKAVWTSYEVFTT